ncbi:monovalent cation/H(+) antiporter subunit G [Polyangium aurulentum]|uniref:monovalent cation/H(+) antiporter subunit G n=1 Tax=Polyangium aurulentum TaxID=2567896 RepID=UPI0010AE80DC|nr:monovalent cation/H(+) antiporter subunit G [Polyangium aurulentum]UQA54797.1 monovalent cation/H(+) antiporter subunit G [Polyangium aurulentum]
MIVDVIEGALLMIGCLFMLLAAVGILRMPDLFTRLQVTSKASVLGMTCILSAAALHFGEPAVTIRAVVIIAFVVLTMPVATHMLARAGYTTNVPLAPETVVNELAGQYDPTTHTLAGNEPRSRTFELGPGAAVVGKRIAELGLPPGVLIRVIHREGGTVVPRGQTILEAGDRLEALVEPAALGRVREILEAQAEKGTVDPGDQPS